MTTAAVLLADLRRQGFTLAPAGNGIWVRPASRLSPEMRQAIAAHRSALLALLGESPAPPPAPTVPVALPQHDHRLPCVCPAGVCWRCCNRPCEVCGQPTGSAFIRTCCGCGLKSAPQTASETTG